MDQRRVLLAFLLMAAVLVASQWWYERMAPPPEEGAPADTTTVVEAPPGERPAEGARPESDAPADTAPTPADTTAPPDTAAATEADPNELLGDGPPAPVVVETPLYRARIDPRGGVLEQVELVRYPSFTVDSTAAILVPSGEAFFERAADVDERRIDLADRLYAPSDSAIRLAESDSAATLRLAWQGGGRRIVQTYRFDPGSYVVDYALDLGEPAARGVLVTGLGPRLFSNEKNPADDHGQLRAVARLDDEIRTWSAGDLAGEPVAMGGAIDWAGLKNKYFLALLLAPDGRPLTATTMRGEEGDSLPVIRLAIGSAIEGGTSRYRVYLGPQEYRRLHALNEGLDEINQYGWSWIRWMITPFAKLIVVVMLWLHQWIPSYGLVLIAFALLVRVAMWPLTVKSYRSIQAMQKIQPEIKRLREKYKDEPQKMQQETMRLYREKKVNPLGGCLPNMIPMPILFALFFVFQSTIEFRDQPFLWLPDLSQPDPFYILPVFMGLTMFATSKLTATDPSMSAMTYVMPIVLTFVFLNLAAGLVLYYAFSNLLTFAQQFAMREKAEAAEEEEPDGGG